MEPFTKAIGRSIADALQPAHDPLQFLQGLLVARQAPRGSQPPARLGVPAGRQIAEHIAQLVDLAALDHGPPPEGVAHCLVKRLRSIQDEQATTGKRQAALDETREKVGDDLRVLPSVANFSRSCRHLTLAAQSRRRPRARSQDATFGELLSSTEHGLLCRLFNTM